MNQHERLLELIARFRERVAEERREEDKKAVEDLLKSIDGDTK